jgi:hypothetical protein
VERSLIHADAEWTGQDWRRSCLGVLMRSGCWVGATVATVLAGDRLLRVDALEVANAPMGAVIDALRGTPGATRTLVLERAGKRITVHATVVRLP